MYSKKEKKYIFAALAAVIVTICIIIYSEEAFNAALEGLKVWWEVVFPSLLPFFIIAEILMGLGVVHFLGALLEPLMRPVFKVPGVGAFAMAMGLASGYPIGAKITANLRRKNLCTKTEGERLVSFTNTADPLFMIGAVAVGMFHRAELGLIIAASHYLSSIIVGFVLRFYRGNEEHHQIFKKDKPKINMNIFSYAAMELIDARKKDGRNIGQLIGDSIKESINTLLLVGGFIILFSVITRMFITTGLIQHLETILTYVIKPFGLPKTVILPLISGFFEITNGANLASQIQAPLLYQMIAANAVIAWSGLSVLAQVATMINGTDIELKPYILSRILQSIIAGISTIFFFNLFQERIVSTFNPLLSSFNSGRGLKILFVFSLGILFMALLISLIIHFSGKIKIFGFHYHK